MRFRQVHLDFHTSEAIDGIGRAFSKEQFQQMLKLGHVDSITVFSKCHHGWAYHPSTANEIHPGLDFDLLGAMIEAAHEVDVKTPVYISAGLDEKMARRHPEWLIRDKDEKTNWASSFMSPGYHQFCFNTPYLDYLLAQIEEVASSYDADGIFLDIVGLRQCYCQYCVSTLRSEGKDPRDLDAVIALGERTYANYANRVRQAIDKYKPGLPVFHNGGHITRGRRDLANMNTHLELESLPTGGWGYDHFPLSARYVESLGLDFMGMTGKFHTTWGEFGGYKHPNALRYEVAISIANGAHCSIGDQLHPDGLMDQATYDLIGKAYSEVEAKETWCTETVHQADVALLSVEAVSGQGQKQGNLSDVGAARILLEGKYLFDVIDLEDDFSQYKVIILPDKVKVGAAVAERLEPFFAAGGKVLASGESGLNSSGDGFALDFGAKWLSENPFKPDYFSPDFALSSLQPAAYVMYGRGQKLELDGGTQLGERQNSYFNRDVFHFCSHQHAPNSKVSGGPGMVEGRHGIYIAWDIFEDYGRMGSLAVKESVVYAIDRLLGENKTLTTSLPAQGVVTLREQGNRYVNHLLYASPVKRGKGIEVIEDILPVYDVDVTVKVSRQVQKVYLAPQEESIDFQQDGDTVSYTVPKVECHQMVIIEF